MSKGGDVGIYSRGQVDFSSLTGTHEREFLNGVFIKSNSKPIYIGATVDNVSLVTPQNGQSYDFAQIMGLEQNGSLFVSDNGHHCLINSKSDQRKVAQLEEFRNQNQVGFLGIANHVHLYGPALQERLDTIRSTYDGTFSGLIDRTADVFGLKEGDTIKDHGLVHIIVTYCGRMSDAQAGIRSLVLEQYAAKGFEMKKQGSVYVPAEQEAVLPAGV